MTEGAATPDRKPTASLRLLAVFGVAGLSLSLSVVVGTIFLTNARWSVEEEIASAYRIASGIIEERSARFSDAPDTMLAAIELAREIDHLRHVAAYVTDPIGVVLSEGSGVPLEPRAAPEWFAAMLAPEPRLSSFPITRYPNILGNVRLVSDPADEIEEVWEDFRLVMPTIAGAGMVALAFALAMILAILRRLGVCRDALDRLRAGDVTARAPEQGLSEFAALAEGVNALATHLESEQRENERLQRRLLTLSEAERSQLASDLHDGVGPSLFALRVALRDAQVLALDAPPMLAAPLCEALGALQRHAEALQRLTRSAIASLRPMLPGDASLDEMLGEMACSFMDIAPSTRIEVVAQPLSLGEVVDLCIYRFAQESVLNAVRHGRAQQVRIELAPEAGPAPRRLVVRVIDDGRGPPNGVTEPSYGLIGIMDRARAIGARFVPPQRAGNRTVTELSLPLDETNRPPPSGATHPEKQHA
ncbi:LapD/MoxY N-terminal periplasmic domain-containing protein [Rubrimonas cliftonensis]|uniref:histidine kinase n=1 Tax=Rubrimonas cliftonensis TaxID=89524 RepID=A0A1H4FGK5_9RHOB|nr:LapD/MoxY N-terminal periplasmic domain-containing protein [Rubrimonas cliftonensis]SEA96489.1 two-component system, NarL family, sensor histidine kinase UhpB [Rubrimonas cliftonensis]